MQEYNIPVTKMHSDTTTISFYGDYDAEKLDLSEEEKEAVLKIERGYNKGSHLFLLIKLAIICIDFLASDFQ